MPIQLYYPIGGHNFSPWISRDRTTVFDPSFPWKPKFWMSSMVRSPKTEKSSIHERLIHLKYNIKLEKGKKLPGIHEKMHLWKRQSVKLQFCCNPCQRQVCRHVLHTICEQAYSMFAKMYQYYWHSTNRNRSFDRQNVIILQSNSKMSGMTSRKSKAIQNGLESRIRKRLQLNHWIHR